MLRVDLAPNLRGTLHLLRRISEETAEELWICSASAAGVEVVAYHRIRRELANQMHWAVPGDLVWSKVGEVELPTRWSKSAREDARWQVPGRVNEPVHVNELFRSVLVAAPLRGHAAKLPGQLVGKWVHTEGAQLEMAPNGDLSLKITPDAPQYLRGASEAGAAEWGAAGGQLQLKAGDVAVRRTIWSVNQQTLEMVADDPRRLVDRFRRVE